MRFIILLMVNIVAFVVIRYVSLLTAFLFGMGASDHYKYESYAYIPGTLLQIFVLLFLYLKENKSGQIRSQRFNPIIIIGVILFLSMAGFLNIIPYSLIPY